MKKNEGRQGEKIVFLDRDGVINQDSPDYIKCPDEFHFIRGSAEAIALLNDGGFEVIVITNQSIIGRKMADPAVLAAIFNKMKAGVRAAGGQIKDIFFCPHAPDRGCPCRKPEPGLILKAADRYSIDVARTWMIGDSAKDIKAGRNAGCDYTGLVTTGNGLTALKQLEDSGMAPDHVAEDLFDMAQWLVSRN